MTTTTAAPPANETCAYDETYTDFKRWAEEQHAGEETCVAAPSGPSQGLDGYDEIYANFLGWTDPAEEAEATAEVSP